MVQYGRPTRSSWPKFIRSSIRKIAIGETIRRSSIRTRMGENSGLDVYVRSSETRVSCQHTWMTSKMSGKNQNMAPMWKKLMKNVGNWRIKIISWPRVLGMHAEWLQTKWYNHWTIYKDVWVTYLCWRNRKITGVAKTSHIQWRGPTTRRDMLKNVLNDTANWRTTNGVTL